MYLLTLLSMTLSLMFLTMSHPVSFSILIFFQTIMISMLCGMISNLFWFSYLLFMVMIGGLLVLFLYMTNVASNEKFKSLKMIYTSLLFSFMLIINYIFIENFFNYMNISLWNKFLINKNFDLILMKFYNFPSNMILILMIIYLLITMIMTVKMTSIKKGALRQKY